MVVINVSLTLAVSAIATVVYGASFDCMPGQQCWPSTEQWQSFNTSLDGTLGITRLWAEPCYEDLNSTACQVVKTGYLGYEARAAQYGNMGNLNWETCAGQGCLLETLHVNDPLTGECKLGRISSYYVDVRSVKDIQSTLKLVKDHNIRLSIKNTGHDYFGRSSAANSLAMWTFNLKDMKYHPEFSRSDCDYCPTLKNIGSIGAGVSAQDAFLFFQKHKMQVTVGAVSSVGIAGGFGQSGGHGIFAPSHGLMVDQAVEFDVITASGKFLTINKERHSDLFWAMRGGGGGTYAVLVNYKFQLYPTVPITVYKFEANINKVPTDITKSTVHRDLATALIDNQTIWSDNKIAGYNFFTPHNFIDLQVLLSTDTAALKKLTAKWGAFLTNYPGLTILENEYKTLSTLEEYAAYVLPQLLFNGPVGVGILEAARLIPRTQFRNTESKTALVEAFLQGMQTSLSQGAGLGTGSGQLYATTPANTYDSDHETGVNPAWRGSLYHVIFGGTTTKADNQSVADNVSNTVAEAIKPMKALTPGGGSYANEGDFKEPKWQETFWGPTDHYIKLLAVKNQYDPEHLFDCFKCVGWRGKQDSFYSCYYPEDEPVPTIPLDPSQE